MPRPRRAADRIRPSRQLRAGALPNRARPQHRREGAFVPSRGVVGQQLPEPAHHLAGQEVASAELAHRRASSAGCVRDWTNQRLVAQPGAVRSRLQRSRPPQRGCPGAVTLVATRSDVAQLLRARNEVDERGRSSPLDGTRNRHSGARRYSTDATAYPTGVRKRPAERVVAIQIAQHEAAAVEEHDQRQRPGRGRVIQPHSQITGRTSR